MYKRQVQALARIIICEQMLRVERETNLQVVLTVHDEIIAVGSDKEPKRQMDKMLSIMKRPPFWAKDLPLDAEGGYDVCYTK